MALSDLLAALDGKKRLWFAQGSWFSVDEIQRLISDNDSLFHSCANLRVALRLKEPLNLSQCLIALDGSAEQVLLIPPGVSEDLAHSFMESCASNVQLTDANGSLSVRTCATGSTQSASHDTTWVLPTSGTTKSPKLVEHRLSSMTDGMRVNSRLSDLIWGLLYDMNRFAGLQVFLQSLVSGAALVQPAAGQSLPSILSLFGDCNVNALSATPTLWRKILMTPEANNLELEQLTLGGEIADQATLNALARRFPTARRIHIYASTEAGVGFAVKDGIAGFPAQFLDTPSNGTELQISDKNHLLIRKAGLPARYLNSSDALRLASGFVDTGDIVERRGDRIFFRGRANGAINVGGNKVMPEEIEEVIRAVPGVSDVAIFAKASAFTGSLVVARIVPSVIPGDQNALRLAVRKECNEHLDAYKHPALIEFVNELEHSQSGKLKRNVET